MNDSYMFWIFVQDIIFFINSTSAFNNATEFSQNCINNGMFQEKYMCLLTLFSSSSGSEWGANLSIHIQAFTYYYELNNII